MRMYTSVFLGMALLLGAHTVWAAEECVTVPLTGQKPHLMCASAYRVYWLKTGDDPAAQVDVNGKPTRMRCDWRTGEFCVTDPVTPLTDVVKPVWVSRMRDVALSHYSSQQAQKVLDKKEQRRLRDKLESNMLNFATMDAQQKQAIRDDEMMLRHLERGGTLQEIIWVDPDVVTE